MFNLLLTAVTLKRTRMNAALQRYRWADTCGERSLGERGCGVSWFTHTSAKFGQRA